MKYLLFDNPTLDYGVKFEQGIVGVKVRGFVALEESEADDVLDKFPDQAREITEAQYAKIKKNYDYGPPSSRRMKPIHQDPAKIPGATYAESTQAEPSEVLAEDLVMVGEVVDDASGDT